VGSAILPLALGDPGRIAFLAAELGLLAGVVLLLAARLDLGVIADLLSQPVLVGCIGARQWRKLDGADSMAASEKTRQTNLRIGGATRLALPGLIVGFRLKKSHKKTGAAAPVPVCAGRAYSTLALARSSSMCFCTMRC
jgi:hypothetical protein